ILDVVDIDSDGNMIQDTQEKTSDVYFKKGVEWISITLEKTPVSTKTETTLKFVTKLNEQYTTPNSVSIRGSKSLLKAAKVKQIDPDTKVESSKAFLDGQLFDDGE